MAIKLEDIKAKVDHNIKVRNTLIDEQTAQIKNIADAIIDFTNRNSVTDIIDSVNYVKSKLSDCKSLEDDWKTDTIGIRKQNLYSKGIIECFILRQEYGKFKNYHELMFTKKGDVWYVHKFNTYDKISDSSIVNIRDISENPRKYCKDLRLIETLSGIVKLLPSYYADFESRLYSAVDKIAKTVK